MKKISKIILLSTLQYIFPELDTMTVSIGSSLLVEVVYWVMNTKMKKKIKSK